MKTITSLAFVAACGPAKTSTTTTTPPPPPPPPIDAAIEPEPLPIDAAPPPVVVKPAVGCIPNGAFTIIEGAVDGAPAICYQRESDKQCSVFPKGGVARAIDEDDVPAIYVQSSIVKDAQVCAGSKCKKLGPKVAAVVAKGGAGAYFGTTDLAAIIGPDVDAGDAVAFAWNVGSDLKLGFQRPVGVAADARATPSQSHIFGSRFVVFWYGAGKGTETLVDSAGKNLGEPFQSDWIGAVGTKYLATLDGSTVRMISVAGAKHGSVDLPLPPVAGVAQVLDDHTLATVIGDQGSRQIAWIKVGDDGSVKVGGTADITCK